MWEKRVWSGTLRAPVGDGNAVRRKGLSFIAKKRVWLMGGWMDRWIDEWDLVGSSNREGGGK